MSKRRILVESEESDMGSDVKRQKRIVVSRHSSQISLKSLTWSSISQVSIDSAATNSDLAQEIANSLGRAADAFTLGLPGGFELRGQE